MTVTLVAAVGANGVIGRNGGLPWRLPEDMAHFKALTLGHVLVMGRRTYDSIGRPLPGRTTVVLTADADWRAGGVLKAGDITEALALARSVDDQVFVVGGARLYEAALPHADRLVITHVEAEPAGDTWFPAVDWSQWQEVRRESYAGFAIVTYERIPGKQGTGTLRQRPS